jgi:hypothetical protein
MLDVVWGILPGGILDDVSRIAGEVGCRRIHELGVLQGIEIGEIDAPAAFNHEVAVLREEPGTRLEGLIVEFAPVRGQKAVVGMNAELIRLMTRRAGAARNPELGC